jgi:hypothetical protein
LDLFGRRLSVDKEIEELMREFEERKEQTEDWDDEC